MNFHNPGCFDPGAKYVLFSGRVVAGAQAIQVVKETDIHNAQRYSISNMQTIHWLVR